jgi:ubiquitin C-terminal hydrolase
MKKIQVYNVPPILIINLKRFRGNYAKSNTLVHFPLKNLDMTSFVVNNDGEKPIYDLFAVSNHFGQLQSGHYTAMCLNAGAWYSFSDHKISAVTDDKQIISSAAYILFYKRRGINFTQLNYKQIQNTPESVYGEEATANLFGTGGT